MQQLNPSEISDIIKGRIDNLNVSSEAQNEGTIVSARSRNGIPAKGYKTRAKKKATNKYIVERRKK
jgi:F0F1-type ATP synthase alpha subunit